jgi:PAS domain-containing protein
MYTDETEEVTAKENFRLSQERFSLAIRSSSDGIRDWDIVNNELFISPQARMQIGYRDHELKNEMATRLSGCHTDITKMKHMSFWRTCWSGRGYRPAS